MMSRFLSLLLITMVACGLFLSDAQAKRFGGGRSFGVSRSHAAYSSPTSSFNRTQPLSQGNRWLGPLAGLALGGILASLFMGNGLANGLFAWLALAGVALVVLRLWRSKLQPNAEQRPIFPFNQSFQANQQPSPLSSYQPANISHALPADFDETSFLREAKVQFLRLQTAYDKKDLNDIREFTTPEVFAEIKLQLQEMGDAPNQTDVISLEAQVYTATDTLVSVKFSGMMKEEINQPAAAFTEMWHFRKDLVSARWIVAGVEQG